MLFVPTPKSYVSSEQARRNRIAKGEECPNCDDTTSIEDNGCTGDDLTYLCTACAHQWDAVNYLGSWRR